MPSSGHSVVAGGHERDAIRVGQRADVGDLVGGEEPVALHGRQRPELSEHLHLIEDRLVIDDPRAFSLAAGSSSIISAKTRRFNRISVPTWTVGRSRRPRWVRWGVPLTACSQ